MDVAVNGVYDIQYANDANKDNQYPAKHFDLFKTLCHFIAAFKVRKPVSTRIFATPIIQYTFKRIRIYAILQCQIDFRIGIILHQRAIYFFVHDKLHTVGETFIVDCNRSINYPYHTKRPAAQLDRITNRKLRMLHRRIPVRKGNRIFDKAACSII